MLQTRWSAEAWFVVRVEFRQALALHRAVPRPLFPLVRVDRRVGLPFPSCPRPGRCHARAGGASAHVAGPRGPVAGRTAPAIRRRSGRLPPAIPTEVLMRRIGLAVVLALSPFVAPFAAEGQTAKVPRIGYLIVSPLVDPPSAERQAFLDGLRDLGYVAGRTVNIEYRSAAWNRELLPDLAAELVELKVDVIVANPGTVEAARDATKTIPIVVPSITDAVEDRLVASLSRPGGNITGPGGTAS